MDSVYLVIAKNEKANINQPLASFTKWSKVKKYIKMMNEYDYNKKRFGEDVHYVSIGVPFYQ